MAKIVLFNMITPEGYFEGENGDLGWHAADEEFNAFAVAQLENADALLFGRKTFDLMQSYWPTPIASKNDPTIARLMSEKRKVVVSRNIEKSDWQNTTFLDSNLLESVLALKATSEKDILMFGSGSLAHNFAELGLIDEYRLLVNPILIGGGKPMFKNLDYRIVLELLEAKTFESGKILLRYRPINEPKYLHL